MALSALGEGARPSFSSRARMKLSIGLLDRGLVLLELPAAAGRTGVTNDQCGLNSAPCSIHFVEQLDLLAA